MEFLQSQLVMLSFSNPALFERSLDRISVDTQGLFPPSRKFQQRPSLRVGLSSRSSLRVPRP